MYHTEMFLFKLFGLQGYYYNNIYLLVDGGWWIAKKKNNYIVESKNLTLYFMLQKQYRMHKL